MEIKSRVGIMSLNIHTIDLNYACRVHSYAFQKFLDEHGIDNEIIDYVPNHDRADFNLRSLYQEYLVHPKDDPEDQAYALEKWSALDGERSRRYELTEKFIKEHMRLSEKQYTVQSLNQDDPGCDIYICATDVLWKYRPDVKAFDPGFFLQQKAFDGKGKIAFSVSHGGRAYTENEKEEVRALTEDFDYVSAREEYLYKLFRNTYKREVAITLDPVFLHEADFYNDIIQKPEEEHYVLIYNVFTNSTGVVESAVKYAAERRLKVIELSDNKANVNFPEGYDPHPVIYGAGIEEWLGYLKYAECIFTNSFHGTCFSIIFNKEFYAGERTGTKIPWLLSLFDLKDRWLKAGEVPDGSAIDYSKTEPLRRKYKQISADYILSAIAETEKRLNGSSEKKKVISGLEKEVFKEQPPKKQPRKSFASRVKRKLRKIFPKGRGKS